MRRMQIPDKIRHLFFWFFLESHFKYSCINWAVAHPFSEWLMISILFFKYFLKRKSFRYFSSQRDVLPCAMIQIGSFSPLALMVAITVNVVFKSVLVETITSSAPFLEIVISFPLTILQQLSSILKMRLRGNWSYATSKFLINLATISSFGSVLRFACGDLILRQCRCINPLIQERSALKFGTFSPIIDFEID